MLMGQRSVGTYGIQSVGNKQTVEAVGMRVNVHTVHAGSSSRRNVHLGTLTFIHAEINCDTECPRRHNMYTRSGVFHTF